MNDPIPRDAERAAVYAAELVAFDGTDLEQPVDLDVVVERVRRLTAGPWWPGPAVEVVAARRDARSSSTRCGSGSDDEAAVIRLAAGQCTIATAAHELAHALAGVDAGHGPRFRSAYIDVVAAITNVDSTDRRHELHVDQLRQAFADSGLTVVDRAWPDPRSTGGAIAL